MILENRFSFARKISIHYKNYTTSNELIFFLLYNRVSGIIWTNQAWSTAETSITVRNFDTTHRGFFNPPRLEVAPH